MSYTYNESAIATVSISDSKKNTRSLALAIVLVITIAIIGIIAYIVLYYRKKQLDEEGSNPASATKICLVDTDCPNSQPSCLNTRCVQCVSSSQCSGSSLTICDASSNTCIQCLVDTDCEVGLTCVGGLCA